jgi:hypothetical protein
METKRTCPFVRSEIGHSQYYQEQEIIEKIAARITAVNRAAADNNASS